MNSILASNKILIIVENSILKIDDLNHFVKDLLHESYFEIIEAEESENIIYYITSNKNFYKGFLVVANNFKESDEYLYRNSINHIIGSNGVPIVSYFFDKNELDDQENTIKFSLKKTIINLSSKISINENSYIKRMLPWRGKGNKKHILIMLAYYIPNGDIYDKMMEGVISSLMKEKATYDLIENRELMAELALKKMGRKEYKYDIDDYQIVPGILEVPRRLSIILNHSPPNKYDGVIVLGCSIAMENTYENIVNSAAATATALFISAGNNLNSGFGIIPAYDLEKADVHVKNWGIRAVETCVNEIDENRKLMELLVEQNTFPKVIHPTNSGQL